jgi:hypothetical protein
MAYKPVPNDVLEVTVAMLLGAQLGLNKTTWQVTGTTTGGATQQEISAVLDGNWAAAYKALVANGVAYRGTSVQKIWPLPRVVREFNVTNAGAGTAGAAACPTQTAGLISFQTANSGRSYRGRIYIPFPAIVDVQNSGAPVVGYGTRTATLATWYVNPITIVGVGGSTTIQQVIFHRKPTKSGGPPPAHSSDNVVSSSTRVLFATQRRRGEYGRQNILPF